MTSHRTLHVLAHDPPPRLPEAALRHAVEEAAALTRRDGRDRHVLFDSAKRRVLVDDWPHDERRGFSVLADITLEAQP